MSARNRDSNFSGQRTAIPFGKFETGSDDVFPSNESMVGREGARAKLIDFLTNAGTRKAILVTGRRGMGKTSFVNYCLKEYEEARIQMYWRSDIGRTTKAWVWLIFVSLLCASSFVLGSWLLKILLDNAINHGNYIFWLPIAILVFYLSYPMQHATKMLAILAHTKPKMPISTNFIGLFIVLSFSYIFIFGGAFLRIFDDSNTVMGDTGSPVVIFIRFLVALAAIFFIGELIDFVLIKIKSQRLGGVVLPFLFGITFILTYLINANFIDNDNVELESQIIFTNLFMVSYFLAIAFIVRGISLHNKPMHIGTLQISSAIKSSRNWFYALGFLFSVLSFFLVTKSDLITKSLTCKILFSTILFLALGITVITRKKESKQVDAKEYRKRNVYSLAILVPKAIFFILLSFYALQPLLTLTNIPGEAYCSWEPSTSKNYLARPFCSVIDNSFETTPQIFYLSKYLPQLLDSHHELAYIVLITVITSLIFWVEYEWIIRPGQKWARDQSMNTSKRPGYYDDYEPVDYDFKKVNLIKDYQVIRQGIRKEIQNYMLVGENIRERSRKLEELTFLGYFKHLHLTTLVSTINLGFEGLDHRSVIHAMLLDIRDQYYEKFVSLRSPRVLVRSFFGLLMAMILVSYLSATHFKMGKNNEISVESTKQQTNRSSNQSSIGMSYPSKPKYFINLGDDDRDIVFSERKNLILVNKYCRRRSYTHTKTNKLEQSVSEASYDHLPTIPKLLCELGGIYAEKILPTLYFELVSIQLNANGLLKSNILNWPFDIQPLYFCISVEDDECKKPLKMSLFLYHLFMFFFIFYLYRRLNKTFEFTPFSVNLEKIDNLLHAMTSTTKTKSNREFLRLIRLTSGFMENEKTLEREKLDPRLVELQFMKILETICRSRPVYFKPLQSADRSPTIEITFVFDELDKLATDIKSRQQNGDPDSNDSELHRLNLMKGLLSNMKRIITSSEARYIFLGGRLLHDDWLADGARRQPLLTSIFSDEIYLPSLLTDASIDWYKPKASNENLPGVHPLHERIEEYFVWQYYLARIRFEQWTTRNWAPIIGLPKWDVRRRGFIQLYYKGLKKKMSQAVKQENFPESHKVPLSSLAVRDLSSGDHLNGENDNSNFELGRLEAFTQFLAYRSAGNPKYLNELLASFVMSADRAVDDSSAIDEGFNCQDVLYFPDHKVMRIQLIARIYRHLCKGFEEKIRGRDDKTIVSLIYLSDFLFKFHGRAFSWESLELIDELVHMHRGHDLRTLLHELVAHYTDRFLHRIINGMYTYRFRSYFSNEIEYLSRHSEEEMAAFNFTLDEGQTLRCHLEGQLESGKDNRDKTDILSMLGELHEFYQEYETARQYYRRCIHARLPMIKEHVGERLGNGDSEVATILAIYTNKPINRDALLALQQWGPITLRWFLQIVMTYEKEHNYNEALIRYERYITFAEGMISAFATEIPKPLDRGVYVDSIKTNTSYDHAFVLEYLGLLCEPLFAYAWLLEKNSYTSGNSHFVLHQGIHRYNDILKTVKPEYLGFIQAQWYKKMGALCFYKGYAVSEGRSYVERARNYYSKSAINLSNYFRKGVSTEYFGPNVNCTLKSAILANRYPTDYNFSVAECLGDLSESILAEINPIILFESGIKNYPKKEEKLEKKLIKFLRQLDIYFFNSKRKDGEEDILNRFSKLYDVNLGRSKKLVQYGDLNSLQKIDLALTLSFSSTIYLLRSGYLESAAREAMHTAEVVMQYFNWYWFYYVTSNNPSLQSVTGLTVIEPIIEKIIWYTGYIYELFGALRSGINLDSKNLNDKKYLMGDSIPSSALTSLCGIGMYLTLFSADSYLNKLEANDKEKIDIFVQNNVKKIADIIKSWTFNEAPDIQNCVSSNEYKYFQYFNYFEKKLIYSLKRHRYSVLNQLNALKTLVDASLFRCYLTNRKASVKNTNEWLQEFYRINEKYNHPLHFTPMQSGLTLYLYAFIRKIKNKKNINLMYNLHDINDFNLTAEYRRLLAQSLDICHMGRGYYEAIDKMYYLYDDFNDNQIHRNHALQMAGSYLVKMSLEKI